MPYPANDFVLMILDGASPPAYASVANCSNVQLERSNSDEDVSTKGDNRNRKLYPEGSQRALSVTADFIADDTALFAALKTAAFSATPSIQARLDDGEDTYTGEFQISSFSLAGGAFGAVTGSITLNSSGVIIKAAAA